MLVPPPVLFRLVAFNKTSIKNNTNQAGLSKPQLYQTLITEHKPQILPTLGDLHINMKPRVKTCPKFKLKRKSFFCNFPSPHPIIGVERRREVFAKVYHYKFFKYLNKAFEISLSTWWVRM